MASSNVTISITAENAQAVAALQRVGSSIAQMANPAALLTAAFQRVVPALGAAALIDSLAGVTHELVNATREAINLADEMGKMSQRIGVGVEELSGLSVAAALSDVGMTELGRSIAFLSRQIQNAAAGQEEAVKLFDDLGIAVRNSSGQIKTADTVLNEIADRFAIMEDKGKRTALAMQLLGRAGYQMIPLLAGGSAALARAREEADLFGLTISDKFAKDSEQFNDNMKRLTLAAKGFGNELAQLSLPTLVPLSEGAVDAAKALRLAVNEAGGLSSVLKAFAVDGFVGGIGKVLSGGVGAAVEQAKKAVGDIAAAGISGLVPGAADSGAVAKSFVAQNRALELQRQFIALDAQRILDNGKLNAIITTMVDGQIKSQTVLDSLLEKNSEQLRILNQELDNAAEARRAGTLTEEQFAETELKLKKSLLDVERERTALRTRSAAEAAQELELKRSIERSAVFETQGPIAALGLDQAAAQRQIDQEISDWTEKERLKTLVTQEFAAKRRRIEEQQNQALAVLRDQQLSGVSAMFGNMAIAARAFGAKGFAAYKAFAIAQATIDTAKAAIAAYQSVVGIPYVGPFLAPIAAGAAVAAGAAQIATIAGQSYAPGYAEGGSPPVGQVAIVGERGPELFIPRERGDIIPNDLTQQILNSSGSRTASSGGAQRDVNMNFHAYFDKRAAMDAMRDDIEGVFIDMMNRNSYRFAR